MADTFKDAKLKLRRAAGHIAELKGVVADHFTAHPPEIEKPEPIDLLKANGINIKVSVKIKALPDEVATVLGDAIHNMRAALDLLAVELVRITPDAAGNPGNTKGVCFPFCDQAADLPKTIKQRNFDRAGPDAVVLLQSLQPYRGGNALLRALHDLDIQDKHHAVVPVGAVAIAGISVKEVDGAPMLFPNIPDQPPVVFPKDSLLASQPVFDTLENLMNMTDSIIKAFEALVAARP